MGCGTSAWALEIGRLTTFWPPFCSPEAASESQKAPAPLDAPSGSPRGSEGPSSLLPEVDERPKDVESTDLPSSGPDSRFELQVQVQHGKLELSSLSRARRHLD